MRREESLTVWPRICSRCWGRRKTVMELRHRCASHIWSCTWRSCRTCWILTTLTNQKHFISGRTTRETQVMTTSFWQLWTNRHGASSLICNFIKVNTNMSHFLFLTLTLQQAPRLLHSPSSFTTDPRTNHLRRACYPTQPHPIGLELSHVPPRPVHWPSGHLSTYFIGLSLFENTALCVVLCLKKIQLNNCLKYTLSEVITR